jgi:hypothetical protein
MNPLISGMKVDQDEPGTKPKLTASERAKTLRAKADELMRLDRKHRRAEETRAKVVLGAGVLAAIQHGRLDRAKIIQAIEPVLRDQDRQALAVFFSENQ